MSNASTTSNLSHELDKLWRIFDKWKHVFDDSTKVDVSTIFDKIGRITNKQFVSLLDGVSSISQSQTSDDDVTTGAASTRSNDNIDSKQANNVRDTISPSVEHNISNLSLLKTNSLAK